jgi:protein TonB
VKEFDEHLMVSQGSNLQTGEVAFNIVQGGGGITSVTMAAPATPATPGVKRITIGGNVQQAKLVSQTRPVYPPLAKQARISGVVHLQAIIAKDGTVMDLKVISGHPLLIPAALDAVKTWVYQTTLLNGDPVEVQTQIDVNFTLSEEGGN